MLLLLLEARENPFVPADKSSKVIKKSAPTPKLVKNKPQKKNTISRTQENNSSTEEVKSVVKVIKKPVVVPTKKSSRKVKSEKMVLNYEKVRFVFEKSTVYIQTKDTLKKRFILKNPTRIVFDYKAKANFASKKEILDLKAFQKVQVGAHGSYYRIVITLQKHFKPQISKERFGILVKAVQ